MSGPVSRGRATYAAQLREAVTRALRGMSQRNLARATEALVGRYREVAPAAAPILSTTVHVAAYAAYRMPATHAAMTLVLGDLARTGVAPRRMLDLGEGTGAAAWAAAAAFGSLESITVLDQVEEALRLGRELVEQAPSAALAATRFERALAGRWPDIEGDLVTVSYVLSELDEDAQSQLVADAMARGGVVVLAEPGAWRARRRVALEPPVDGWTTPAARVLRRPAKRKGLVELEVCRPDGTAGREVVSKRQGERYAMARDTEWGDRLPER